MVTYYPAHPQVGHKVATPAIDKIVNAIVDEYGNVGNEYNASAIKDNFWHLVVAEPDKTPETKGGVTTIPAYEPLDSGLLRLPQKDVTPLGPAAACATNCQAQHQLRQTQCDILRERVAQALRDGHCPSLIKAVSEFNPCGGVTTTSTAASSGGCAGGQCSWGGSSA
jgi:hypothetical protein